MLAVTKTDPGGVKSGAHQALGRQRWAQGEQDRAPVPRNATLLLPGGHSPDLSQGLEISNDQLLRQRITPYQLIRWKQGICSAASDEQVTDTYPSPPSTDPPLSRGGKVLQCRSLFLICACLDLHVIAGAFLEVKKSLYLPDSETDNMLFTEKGKEKKPKLTKRLQSARHLPMS